MSRSHASVALVLLVGAALQAQPPATNQATIRFLQELQTPDGGFLPVPADSRLDQQPRGSLRATLLALRALKYFGGKPRDAAGARKFIGSCFDKKSGGFGDQPGGKPDVFSTAIGLMAAAEAGLPLKAYSNPCVQFLAENAKEFEDIRIAAAGFECAGQRPALAARWHQDLSAKANVNGTFGDGAALARTTGSSAVTILRLGGKLKDTRSVVAALNDGQNKDGAWGKDDSGSSDLETTYRIARCYHMLKVKPPNIAALRAFIARCRNDDGGYGVKPGAASNVGGTYFASIILHWLNEN